MGLPGKVSAGPPSSNIRISWIVMKGRNCSIHSWRRWLSPSTTTHRYKWTLNCPISRRKARETPRNNRCAWCLLLPRGRGPSWAWPTPINNRAAIIITIIITHPWCKHNHRLLWNTSLRTRAAVGRLWMVDQGPGLGSSRVGITQCIK